MNPRLLGAGFAAVALALLILLTRLPLSGPEPEPARQYAAIVDRLFIFKGWLTLTPARTASSGDEGLSQIGIDWSRVEEGDRALAQSYYRSSYLPDDIRRFNHPYNSTDRSLFDVLPEKDGPDRLRRIAPTSHEFRSPFNPASRWLGKLYYADTPRPAGGSGADSTQHPALILEPAGGTAPRIVLTPLAAYEGTAGREVQVLGPAHTREVTDAIIRFTDAAHRPLASLWRVKNQVLLLMAGAPADGEQIEIRVNGHDLPNGPENRGDLHVLPADARLAFRDRTPPRISRRRSKAPASTAQQVWLLQDPAGPDPIYDARTEIWHNSTQNPLFPRLTEALGAIAAQKGTDSDTPVTLTLSRALEAQAANILQQRLIKASGTGQPQSLAAVTLMDALSGNLLALPSAPIPPDVSAPPGVLYREEAEHENHNFTRLAIGSVAKVLLGAAILQADLAQSRQPGAVHAYPGPLLTMLLPPSAADSCGAAAGLEPGDCQFHSVLGIPWEGPGIHDEQAGWIDLREAIARSINRYALTLLTLAAVRPTAAAPAADDARRIGLPQDQVKIGGVQLTERPANLLFEPGEHGNFLAEDLNWVGVARQLYRINTAAREQSSLNSARDYIWDGLPCPLRPAQHSPLLATLSPETENLRLDTIQLNGASHEDFRERYLPLILGDGESRWSNVELAEAFASLVQNRRVEASLVSSVQPCDRRPPPPWPRLDPEVLQALSGGMSAVITHPQGTAHRLEPVRRMLAQAACRLQPQRAFALFGKTGTPELAQFERAPEAKLIEELSQARVLIPDPKDANPETRAILYRHADGRTEKVGPQLVRELWSEVSQGRGQAADQLRTYFRPAARGLMAHHSGCGTPGERLLWRNVFRQIEAYNLSPASHSSVRIQGGQLVSNEQCFVRTRPGQHAFGKHFVFVAALYDQTAASGSSCTGEAPQIDVARAAPVSAIAGVVAIQDAHLVAHHKLIHVQTAGDLLCGPVAQRLGLQVDAGACRATLDRAGD